MRELIKKLLNEVRNKETFVISKGLKYHLDNDIKLTSDNVYRLGSEKYITTINEARNLYNKNHIELHEEDVELISTDLGQQGIYEGDKVWLDLPMMEAEYKGKDVELNKPKRGGSKKFYVYVKNDKGNVVKVSFGAKSGGGKLSVKLNDPEARKNFAARHNCEEKNDKTKAGYWSCRLPRYAKSLGLSGGGQWW